MTNNEEFEYFEDGQIDRVMGLIWQIAQESYVTHQRVLALEELLTQKGLLVEGELDTIELTDQAQDRLTQAGLASMARLMRTISEVDDNRAPLREQFTDELAEANK